eukprot:762026-Hanusia_phi.AAC.9
MLKVLSIFHGGCASAHRCRNSLPMFVSALLPSLVIIVSAQTADSYLEPYVPFSSFRLLAKGPHLFCSYQRNVTDYKDGPSISFPVDQSLLSPHPSCRAGETVDSYGDRPCHHLMGSSFPAHVDGDLEPSQLVPALTLIRSDLLVKKDTTQANLQDLSGIL